MKSKNDLLKIAQIGKTIGVRGELKLHIKSDFPEQFKKGNIFIISKDKTLKIEKFNPKRFVVKFEGYDTIEDASSLINKFLYTTYEDTQKNCSLKKDEFFWFDLIGSKVIENDNILGIVENIERFEPNDFLIIKSDKKFIDEGYSKTFLIPYIERYVIEFDKDKKIVYTRDTFEILKNS